MRPTRRTILVLGLIALVTGGSVTYAKLIRWKRFHVVQEGVLYRSGSLRNWQLRQAIDRYGIRTVYSLTFTNNADEASICDRMGVTRHFHYLAGNGVGTDDPYLRFLEVVRDPTNQPVLVHCSAGVQRTGGACALYRVLVQGWDFDDAIEEMIALGNEGRQNQIDQLKALVTSIRSEARLANTGKERLR